MQLFLLAALGLNLLSSSAAQKGLLNLFPVRDAAVYGREPRPSGHRAAHITASLIGCYCQVTLCVCSAFAWPGCDWLCRVRRRRVTSLL